MPNNHNISTHKHLPPVLLKARRRIAWFKTIIMMALFGGIMATHVWYVWQPGSPEQTMMVAIPVVLYSIAECFILANRIREIPAYRKALAAAEQNYNKQLNSNHLAAFSEAQKKELVKLEIDYDASRRATGKTLVTTIVISALFVGNIALCRSSGGGSLAQFLSISAVIMAFATVGSLFALGQAISNVSDEKIRLKHLNKERLTLRDMRRELTDESLTGALSTPETLHNAQGGLSTIDASNGNISSPERTSTK